MSAEPVSSGDSAAADLMIQGTTMIGFPGMCSYEEIIGVRYDIELGVTYATTGDQFAWTCGYYTEVLWMGNEGVHIEVWSMNALASAVSAFAIVATSALLL
jgi:hypothetical protein